MNNLEQFLAPAIAKRRPPVSLPPTDLLGFECPKGLNALIEISDGFITCDRIFRVFGITQDDEIPSLIEWNTSPWKNAYGSLAKDLLFIAEDIFGDQYGYSFRGKREFVKFYCEGGEIEVLEGINWFIEALAAPIEWGAVDGELLTASTAQGFRPAANEHLAFKLPLIVGGERNVSNLGVESVQLHLGTLAQLSLKNLRLPEGAKIASFRS